MERAAHQQRTSSSSLRPRTSGHATDERAAIQAEALVRAGNVTTEHEAALRIAGLRASVPRHEILVALLNQHLSGAINEQTYLLYAKRLKADVGLDAPIGPWWAACQAIDRGASAEEAIAAHDVRDPDDIAEIHAYAERVAATGVARVPRDATRAAREAIGRRATGQTGAVEESSGQSRKGHSLRERLMSRMRRR
jgi:hypothetical protein